MTDHPGALVLSLDFEIHWGVREIVKPEGHYKANLLGVREVVPRTLELFREFGVAATWATVGFLLAQSRAEIELFSPRIKPQYADPSLSPYLEKLGEGEADDPYHYAPSLVELIRRTPRQEIATHTFSHYYCLEPGQTRETFRADLASAVALARARGLDTRSIVFPGNQHNPDYAEELLDAGLTSYRGTQKVWMYSTSRFNKRTLWLRGARMADSFLNVGGDHTIGWNQVWDGRLANVQASFFVRPTRPSLWRWPLRELQYRRIVSSMIHAARERRILHLWWHPHNFGRYVDANMAYLRRCLEAYAECRDKFGMRSMSMHDVAEYTRPPR